MEALLCMAYYINNWISKHALRKVIHEPGGTSQAASPQKQQSQILFKPRDTSDFWYYVRSVGGGLLLQAQEETLKSPNWCNTFNYRS